MRLQPYAKYEAWQPRPVLQEDRWKNTTHEYSRAGYAMTRTNDVRSPPCPRDMFS